MNTSKFPVCRERLEVDEISEIQKAYKIIGRRKELEDALAAVRAKKHLLIEGWVRVGKTVIALAVLRHLNRHLYRVDGDERYTESKLTGWFDPPILLLMIVRHIQMRPE